MDLQSMLELARERRAAAREHCSEAQRYGKIEGEQSQYRAYVSLLNAAESEIAAAAMLGWVRDYRTMLQKGFRAPQIETCFISGDRYSVFARDNEQGFKYHLRQCDGLIALCQLYGIPMSGMAIWDSVPVVFVDQHPRNPIDSFGKWGHIIQQTRVAREGASDIYLSDFDLEPFGVVCTRSSGHFLIEI